MVNTILFPSSYMNRRKIDEDMAREYDAALDTGLFDTIIFGYDDWFEERKLRLSFIPEKEVNAIYRGWMMKPEQYSEFYDKLLSRNVRLQTTPQMYTLMHIFPNIYPQIEKDTARIHTFPLHSDIDIRDCIRAFGRFMVKDYVKSVKGTEFPTYFDESTSQSEFDRWMEIFYDYRGDLLTGGICIKEYLELKRYGERTNEYRVFYGNNEVISVCRNSLQGNFTTEPPEAMIEKYKNLDSVFYTVDFAELSDGSWKIIEAGDGSVSGLSEGQDYGAFFRGLYHAMN